MDFKVKRDRGKVCCVRVGLRCFLGIKIEKEEKIEKGIVIRFFFSICCRVLNLFFF